MTFAIVGLYRIEGQDTPVRSIVELLEPSSTATTRNLWDLAYPVMRMLRKDGYVGVELVDASTGRVVFAI